MTAAAHGPTRARRALGELALVPDAPRQVREIWVKVEQLDNGLLRFSQPRTPGWVRAARTPVDVVRVLREAFVERQVSSYAEWRGSIYDHPAAPQLRRHKPRSRGKRRADCYSADAWVIDDRGLWVSPGAGHRFKESSQVVKRVMAQRVAMGLPARPSSQDGQRRLEEKVGTQLALLGAMELAEESA